MKTSVLVSTFSIAAVDVATGDIGVACASKFLAAGSLVPWAAPGAGAIATQALVNANLGARGLDLLAAGVSAADALARLLAGDPAPERRQVGIVDRDGGSAAHTGTGCQGYAGHRTGPGHACQGNMLAGPDVLDAMAAAFAAMAGTLGDRLIAALSAGDAEGGDRRGRQSAGVTVVRSGGGYQGLSDTVMDLRVDDHPDPLGELRRLQGLHALYFGASPPEQRIPLEGAVLAELLAIAVARGHADAAPAPLWSAPARDALDRLTGEENLEERIDLAAGTIDRVAYDHLIRNVGTSGR